MCGANISGMIICWRPLRPVDTGTVYWRHASNCPRVNGPLHPTASELPATSSASYLTDAVRTYTVPLCWELPSHSNQCVRGRGATFRTRWYTGSVYNTPVRFQSSKTPYSVLLKGNQKWKVNLNTIDKCFIFFFLIFLFSCLPIFMSFLLVYIFPVFFFISCPFMFPFSSDIRFSSGLSA